MPDEPDCGCPPGIPNCGCPSGTFQHTQTRKGTGCHRRRPMRSPDLRQAILPMFRSETVARLVSSRRIWRVSLNRGTALVKLGVNHKRHDRAVLPNIAPPRNPDFPTRSGRGTGAGQSEHRPWVGESQRPRCVSNATPNPKRHHTARSAVSKKESSQNDHRRHELPRHRG